MGAGCKAHENWPLHDLIYGMLCRPLRVCSSVPSLPVPSISRVECTVRSCRSPSQNADGYVLVSVVETLHARLHALETWKAKIKLPSTSCARKRRRLSAPERATSPWRRCSSKSEHRTTAITPATAAAVFFQQQDLLQL